MVCGCVLLNLARVVPPPYSPLPVWRNTSKGMAVKCVPRAEAQGSLLFGAPVQHTATVCYSSPVGWATPLFLLLFLSLFLASHKYISARNKAATAKKKKKKPSFIPATLCPLNQDHRTRLMPFRFSFFFFLFFDYS